MTSSLPGVLVSPLVPMHGIGSRHDLPLPFGFVVAGATAALLVSFVVLVFAWQAPRYATLRGVAWATLARVVDARPTRWLARGVILALYGWVALAMTVGQDLLTNPVFGFVYVWMWVGLVPLSLLLGGFWRATNPLRTVHLGLCALARIDPEQGLLPLPRRVGVWPAALGIVAFGWLELVQPDRATLVVLRVWALAWVVLVLLGAVVFGSRWVAAADPFEAYATAVSQLSPWARLGPERRLGLTDPLAHLADWSPPPGAAALVAVLLGNTAYDSFANTTWWIVTSQASTASPLLWGTGGLVGVNLLVLVTFALGSVGLGPFGSSVRVVDLPRLMAPSLVPIAVGYAVAHYATLLIVEGQRTAIFLSDPLGRGWNALGTGTLGIDSSIFDHPTVIATIQAVAIVAGHVVGIVVAHERSLRLLRPGRGRGSAGGRGSALVGQLPLLAVMVGYTCAGLVLLFSP